MASRAETSRLASLAVSSEMVSWLSMEIMSRAMRLFDDLRHEEQAVGLGGRVAQGFLVGQGRAHFIRTGDVDERHGMGGRFDLADVQFLQLLDVAENVAELRAEFGRFFRRKARRAKCATSWTSN